MSVDSRPTTDLATTVIRWLNPLVVMLLRSGLHAWISRDILLFTFRGRRTGREYTTPLSYIRKGATVYCFTHSSWWKNLEGGARVELLVQGAVMAGTARAYADDPARVREPLRQFLIRVPRDARFYDVPLDRDGRPLSGALDRAAANTVMIVVDLDAGDEIAP